MAASARCHRNFGGGLTQVEHIWIPAVNSFSESLPLILKYDTGRVPLAPEKQPHIGKNMAVQPRLNTCVIES